MEHKRNGSDWFFLNIHAISVILNVPTRELSDGFPSSEPCSRDEFKTDTGGEEQGLV